MSQETKIFPQACCTWYLCIAERQVVDICECPANCSPCTREEKNMQNFAVSMTESIHRTQFARVVSNHEQIFFQQPSLALPYFLPLSVKVVVNRNVYFTMQCLFDYGKGQVSPNQLTLTCLRFIRGRFRCCQIRSIQNII